MRRFSILGLMGLVLAIGVGFAALRNANDLWAGSLMMAVLGMLGYSILVAIHRPGSDRAGWLGFLVVGGGYLLAVRTLPAHEAGWLPTSRLLDYVENQVVGPTGITYSFVVDGPTITSPTSAFPTPPAPVPVPVPSTGNTSANFVYFTSPTPVLNAFPSANSPAPTGGAWVTFLPGASNGPAFKSVGQSLFALIAGWIGASVSRRMLIRPSHSLKMEDSSVATTSPNML